MLFHLSSVVLSRLIEDRVNLVNLTASSRSDKLFMANAGHPSGRPLKLKTLLDCAHIDSGQAQDPRSTSAA
jgi:hypothetical protein